MHNFPPHLSCVATLPENTLATEQARCFPMCGWLWGDHEWWDQLTTDKFLEISSTDWYVCGSPFPDLTRGHQPTRSTFSAVGAVRSLREAPRGRLSIIVSCLFSSLRRLCSLSTLTWKFLHQLLRSLYPCREWRVNIRHFHYPINCQVKEVSVRLDAKL